MNDDLRLHGLIGGGAKIDSPEQIIQIAVGNSVKSGDLCTITQGTPLVTNSFIFEEESDVLYNYPIASYGFTANEFKTLEIDSTRLLVSSLNSAGHLIASIWSLNSDGSITPRNGVVLYTKATDETIQWINICINTTKTLIVFSYRRNGNTGVVLQQVGLNGTAINPNPPFINTTNNDYHRIEFLSSETELIIYTHAYFAGYGLSGTSFVRRGQTNPPSGFGEIIGFIKSRTTKEVVCISIQQYLSNQWYIKALNVIAWNNLTTLMSSPLYSISNVSGGGQFVAKLLEDKSPLSIIVSGGSFILSIEGNSNFTFTEVTSASRKNTITRNIINTGEDKVDVIGSYSLDGNSIIEHYGISRQHIGSPQRALSSQASSVLTSLLASVFNNFSRVLYFDATSCKVKKLRTIGKNAIAKETRNSGTVKVVDLRNQ